MPLLAAAVAWVHRHPRLARLPCAGALGYSILVGSDRTFARALVLAAVWATAIAVAESVCVRYRRTHTSHPSNPALTSPLRRERGLVHVFWIAAGVQSAIAIDTFVIPWTSASGLHVTLFLLLAGAGLLELLLAFVQPAVQTRIKEVVGGNTRTQRFSETPLLGETLGSVLARTARDRFILHRWLARLFESRVGVSFYVLAISFSVTSILSIDASAMFRDVVRPPHVRAHAKHNVRTPITTSPPTKFPPNDAGEPSPSIPLSSVETWEHECGPLPGVDAPTWAQTDFDELYLGFDTGPGAVAGCTGPTQYVHGSSDFAYIEGGEDGAVKSVAVVSMDAQAFPPALFMAPAAQTILDLIKTDGAVGGTGRLDAGKGDLYLAYTYRGTTALTRAAKADAYTAVPAAVVDEWYADMAVRKAWLWPVREANQPGTGYERFSFDAADGQGTGLSVVYDPTLNLAIVPTPTGTVTHTADGQQLPVRALESLGAKIDPTLPGIG
jgi:hypothetical protein